MAAPLSAEREPLGNVTQASTLEFIDKHIEVDEECAEAKETVRSINRRRKDLRKTIQAAGINMEAFDRAIADNKRSGAEREAENRHYAQYMAWLRKPVGYQTTMFNETDTGAAAFDVHELERADSEGYDAGKNGAPIDNCSWTPGTEAAARWMTAWGRGSEVWLEGQKEIAATLGNGATPPRGRGRPKGSKNRINNGMAASA